MNYVEEKLKEFGWIEKVEGNDFSSFIEELEADNLDLGYSWDISLGALIVDCIALTDDEIIAYSNARYGRVMDWYEYTDTDTLEKTYILGWGQR